VLDENVRIFKSNQIKFYSNTKALEATVQDQLVT